jgi:hypothetical protein
MMTHERDIMQHSWEGMNDGHVKEGFYSTRRFSQSA